MIADGAKSFLRSRSSNPNLNIQTVLEGGIRRADSSDQARTLKDHTFAQRAVKLDEIIRKTLLT